MSVTASLSHRLTASVVNLLSYRTYTDDFLPCSALFFDMGIAPHGKESDRRRRFLACARAEKNASPCYSP